MRANGVKSAFAWSAVDHFGREAGQLVIGVVLGRLLSPSEFGLIGMLSIFLAIGSAFATAGLGSALIQRKELSDDDTKSCFYLNFGVAAAMAAVLCLISPLVAAFYGSPVLEPMLCVLSLQLVFSSFMTVPDALRSRDLDFRTLAIINWTGTLLSGAVAVLMAWLGYGVWSLVTQVVVRSFISSALLWMLRPWRPRGTFRWSCIRSLWSFSSGILGASLLAVIFGHLYPVVIGKFYSAADLGFYTQAQRIKSATSHALESIVSRVALPVLSQLQDDTARMKARLRQLLRLTATFHFPLMLGMAASAPTLISALLTDKWLPSAPLLQVLTFAGLLYPLHAYHLRTLQAVGRSDLFLRLEIVKRVLGLLILVLTAPYGVLAMVWGLVAFSFIAYWINSFFTVSLIGYGWGAQMRDLLPMVLLGLAVALAGYGSSVIHIESSWGALALQVLVMTSVFSLSVFVLARRWFPDSVRLVKVFSRVIAVRRAA